MNSIYSVSQINSYIKGMFAQDFMLHHISVQGEVSNCKYHTSGHIYFTLKDAKAAISCVMFASARRGLAFRMKDGDRVVVTGPIDVYERDGRYQLYAKQIRLQGAGLLYEKFLALKKELEEMGMFDPIYKQPIPKYVKRLGIVTAPTGAAIQDIRNISLRRNPYIQLILYPAQVQGEGAKESIIRGIETLDAMNLDCIIIGRGGGSIEDLWAFNEEEVARAVFQCGTPVISAVGHETDTTITDFVADLRAPTPSAAAELAVADVHEILRRLDGCERRLQIGMDRHVEAAGEQLSARAARWKSLSPEHQLLLQREQLKKYRIRLEQSERERLREARDRLDGNRRRLIQDEKDLVTDRRHRLQLRIQKMEGLSPLRKLNQGYARAEKEGGRAITSVDEVCGGDLIRIYVSDGCIRSSVLSTEHMDPERKASVLPE